MFAVMRQLAKSVRNIFAPERKLKTISSGKPPSIGLTSTVMSGAVRSSVSPHSLPAISIDAGDATAIEPTKENRNSSLANRPLTLVGVFRHVFISLPNTSADEVMFISLAQDYGLNGAIERAEYFHLKYHRALEALQEAMRGPDLAYAPPRVSSSSIVQR